MESYKRPRRVVFVSEYPTTATGKIRRVELRAEAEKVLREPEVG
jgi:acyl-coenzyme A synthetase/AMP-(fatty) acid ligase